MSPESGNVFDNLHMLHGILYDILAYEGWSTREKRKEIDRVLLARSEHPRDRELARKVTLPDPARDPRIYDPSLTAPEGEMTRMMKEMLEDMWPMMSPDGSAEVPTAVAEQLRLKSLPGLQLGEHPGSPHDALMKVVPDMKMTPDSMEPGRTLSRCST